VDTAVAGKSYRHRDRRPWVSEADPTHSGSKALPAARICQAESKEAVGKSPVLERDLFNMWFPFDGFLPARSRRRNDRQVVQPTHFQLTFFHLFHVATSPEMRASGRSPTGSKATHQCLTSCGGIADRTDRWLVPNNANDATGLFEMSRMYPDAWFFPRREGKYSVRRREFLCFAGINSSLDSISLPSAL
jgi:hypothetical protein